MESILWYVNERNAFLAFDNTSTNTNVLILPAWLKSRQGQDGLAVIIWHSVSLQSYSVLHKSYLGKLLGVPQLSKPQQRFDQPTCRPMLYLPSSFTTWCLPRVRNAPYLSCLSPQTLRCLRSCTSHFHHQPRACVRLVKFLPLE